MLCFYFDFSVDFTRKLGLSCTILEGNVSGILLVHQILPLERLLDRGHLVEIRQPLPGASSRPSASSSYSFHFPGSGTFRNCYHLAFFRKLPTVSANPALNHICNFIVNRVVCLFMLLKLLLSATDGVP